MSSKNKTFYLEEKNKFFETILLWKKVAVFPVNLKQKAPEAGI